jgi:hypothetical protein
MMQRIELRRAGWEALVDGVLACGLVVAVVIALQAALPSMTATTEEFGAVLRLGLGCLGRPAWAC